MKPQYIALAIFLALSCTSRSNVDKEELPVSKIAVERPKASFSLDNKIEALKKSMIDYMREAHPGYTERDVNACAGILTEYLLAMDKTNTKQEGQEVVKSAILQLNNLNEKCGGALIETGEREQIAEIIILMGNQKGYNTTDEDITEPWREW